MSRRLYTNHLHGPKANARLKKYLVDDPKRPDIVDYKQAKNWIKENCYFRYIEIGTPENFKERAHIEGLIGFVLNSHYIEKEH